MKMTKMDLSIPYYSDNSRVSNSSIGWFLNKGPTFFHNMLTGVEKGESGAQLDRGTMIHEYILRPEDFSKDYVLYTGIKPSSAQQEKFCKALINTTEIETNKAVLKAYKSAYSVVNKKDSEILLKGLEMASTLKEYIDICKICEEKHLIIYSESENVLLSNIYKVVHEHKLAYNLLFPTDPDEKWYHEFHINWEYETKEGVVKCKSLLDHVSFNKKKKICTIVDLKTTVHVNEFEKSVEQYDYYRQIAYYEQAVEWYINNILVENAKDWVIKSYIVAVDSIMGNSCRVFAICDFYHYIPIEYKHKWKIINEVLTDIAWHFKNNLWDHTREYYELDGSEELKI